MIYKARSHMREERLLRLVPRPRAPRTLALQQHRLSYSRSFHFVYLSITCYTVIQRWRIHHQPPHWAHSPSPRPLVILLGPQHVDARRRARDGTSNILAEGFVQLGWGTGSIISSAVDPLKRLEFILGTSGDGKDVKTPWNVVSEPPHGRRSRMGRPRMGGGPPVSAWS
jgi:hypothetical protein